MKQFLVTFSYKDKDSYQILISEDTISKYMEKVHKKEVFWNETNTYATWINLDNVRRITIAEYNPGKLEQKKEENEAGKVEKDA